MGTDGATPGTGVYRIRRILGDHALRYMTRNPLAAMRLSDPEQTRIHTIAYELDEIERKKAGNNDYQIRGTIGLILRLSEGLRIMPTGTPEYDAAWRAREAEIDELLLQPFCDLCAGAGLSYRTIRKHPHENWERYQLAGLDQLSRFQHGRSRSTASSPMPRTRSTLRTSGTRRTGQPRAMPTTTISPRPSNPTSRSTPDDPEAPDLRRRARAGAELRRPCPAQALREPRQRDLPGTTSGSVRHRHAVFVPLVLAAEFRGETLRETVCKALAAST